MRDRADGKLWSGEMGGDSQRAYMFWTHSKRQSIHYAMTQSADEYHSLSAWLSVYHLPVFVHLSVCLSLFVVCAPVYPSFCPTESCSLLINCQMFVDISLYVSVSLSFPFRCPSKRPPAQSTVCQDARRSSIVSFLLSFDYIVAVHTYASSPVKTWLISL